MISVISIQTKDRSEMVDITSRVQDELSKSGITDGLCCVYVPHTTAGITINEGADPSVAEDIQTMLNKIVPWKGSYRHLEGNAAAHIKSSLMGSSVLVLVESRRLKLGTWQSIFFCEFDGPRSRKVYIIFK